MKLPKTAREFALKHHIPLGHDEHGFFIRKGSKIIERVMDAANVHKVAGALAMMRRYLRNVAHNPVPESSSKRGQKARVLKAARLYQDFSGMEPETLVKVDMPDYDVAIAFGECESIQYKTMRDGVVERYIHHFKAQSRPLICVSEDGKQLYLLGGKYQFTDRGIVDK